MQVSDIRRDLLAEQQALDHVMGDLSDEQWATDTASDRWDVADQIGHLTYFDNMAVLAITDPDVFRQRAESLMAADTDDDVAADNLTLGEYRAMSPTELLDAWRANRARLADASSTLGEDTRIGWYGPSLGSKSFLTARLMECWAHGRDIGDALDIELPATDRIHHIALLGFITRGWTYINRGLEVPDAALRVEITAPSGAVWTFGPDDATESVTGSAEDFCLVVTQRRHVDATDLSVHGDAAREWLVMAQAFAGPATDGPPSR